MRLIGAVVAGVGLVYFFDPQSGKRRRLVLRDRLLAIVRRLFRRTARAGRGAVKEAEGLAQRAMHLREEPKSDLTDETVTAKIMSEVFRDPELPKGDVNVNVENGVAVLRGTVERPDLVDELVGRVHKVQGVRDVNNLLEVQGAGSSSP